MKKAFVAFFSCFVVFFSGLSFASSNLSIKLPTDNGGASISNQTAEIAVETFEPMGYFQLINKYLRIAITVIAFVALLYAAFMLITKGAEALGTLGRVLIAIVGGVLLAILIVALVRLVANLF